MEIISLHLQTAIDAAKMGAKVATDYYKMEAASLEISQKKDKSLVTKADLVTENAIKEHIRTVFPNVEFITEENDNTTKSFEDVWIIDPIDGTREFSRGIDLWGINIAYAKNKEIVVGVSYFPALNILIYAEKDKGAFVNGNVVQVAKTDSIAKSLLGYSHINYFTNDERKFLFKLIENVNSTRSFVSCYSAYCVATGKLDFFLASSHNRIWDIAPYICIIEEAGGMVTDWEGNKMKIDHDVSPVLASNGILHKVALEILSKT